jgi:transposase-like protein
MARGSAGPRGRQAEGYWRRVIGHWEGSGQTISGFCRRQGVSEASFHAWRRRLRNPTIARGGPDYR